MIIKILHSMFCHHHQIVLLKDRAFTAHSGTKVAVLLGVNRCGSKFDVRLIVVACKVVKLNVFLENCNLQI